MDQGLERLVSLLGGWPKYFRAAEKRHGLSLVSQLRRDRLLDEGVFGMVIRYAVHRAAWDRISAEILADLKRDQPAVEAEGEKSYLSGKEQERAYHFNKLAQLERDLLATPYLRKKTGEHAQTSFMEKFDAPTAPAGGDDGAAGTVMPFQPIGRKRYT